MFLCLITILLFPYTSVRENTSTWVLHFLQPYWMELFSFHSRKQRLCLEAPLGICWGHTLYLASLYRWRGEGELRVYLWIYCLFISNKFSYHQYLSFDLILTYFEPYRGRVDDLWFFEYLSPFCLLLIEFLCIFSIPCKTLPYFVFIIVFWLGCDRPSGLLLFVPALLLSILTPLFLPSSSVSLSYFVLAVPIRECLGKHSCMSSAYPIAILNSTFIFSRGEIVCNLGLSFVYQNQIKLN